MFHVVWYRKMSNHEEQQLCLDCVSGAPIMGDIGAPVMGDIDERHVTPQSVQRRVEERPHASEHVDQSHAGNEWEGAYRVAGNCPARYAAFQVNNAQENPQRPSTTWGHEIPSGEMRPTIRQRLNELAIIISDGCHQVPSGFQHTNILYIDNLLTSAHAMVSTAYEVMALVNELNHAENCTRSRCHQCAEPIIIE